MIVHFGYTDGSGAYFISIDTDKCDGCGTCVPACPSGVLEILEEDPHDPFRELPVATVVEGKRRKIKYACAPCKPMRDRGPLPCVLACRPGAIIHSW